MPAGRKGCVLQQDDVVFGADAAGLRIPQGSLYLTDVHLIEQQHTQTALTDTAADGQRQLAVKKHFVEGQLGAGFTAGKRELLGEGVFVHTDMSRSPLRLQSS